MCVKSEEDLPVLAIMFMPSGGLKLLLWSHNQGSTGLFPVSDFEVLDATLPRQWVACIGQNGYLQFSPEEWQAENFWELYQDEDPQAVETFHRCMEAIDGSS